MHVPPRDSRFEYSRLLWCVWGAVILFVSLRTLYAPQIEFGDGREYVLQTQAIVFDRSFAIDLEKRQPYWNSTNPYGVKLALLEKNKHENISAFEGKDFNERTRAAGGFGSLYLDKYLNYRYVHFWLYSAMVAPLYAVFHFISPESALEYQSFRLMNLLFLFVPLTLLLRGCQGITWQRLLFAMVMLASPLTPQAQFTHTELFCFFCILSSLSLVESQKWRAFSPLLLGLGAMQNIPLLFFMPLHALLVWRKCGFVFFSKERRLLLGYALSVVLPLFAVMYFQSCFGAWNLVAKLGDANIANITAERVFDMFFSPIIGALWYYPASWLFIAAVFASGYRLIAVLTWASIVLVASIAAATANLNSAQLSACRYAVWFLAPSYWLVLGAGALVTFRSRRILILMQAAAFALCAFILLWLGSYRLLAGEWIQFFSGNRLRPEIAAIYRHTHYNDDVEVLAEHIMRAEMPKGYVFDGIYVWNIGAEDSLWIISKRAWQRLSSLELESKSSSLLQDEELARVFDVESKTAGVFELKARKVESFKTNPVYGSYLMLWPKFRVDGAKSNVKIFVNG